MALPGDVVARNRSLNAGKAPVFSLSTGAQLIIKRRYTANFTTIGNALFEDERLAADEVGILAYLRSRPHDWEVRRPALARRWNMGRDAIKRVIANLVRTGWCVARKDRAPNGTFFMIYEIRDEPGPTLTDEEVRRALSLVSSEAASDETDVIVSPQTVPETGEPPTPNPSLADPSPGDPHVANNIIQNTDSPRKDSTQKPEREGAREREKHALHLAEFKRRWPTNADDDQVRVDRAWFALSFEEGEAALAGITPFLEKRKELGRKYPPAGFTYLEQKRWTLLEQAKAEPPIIAAFRAGSAEAKAIGTLFEIDGKAQFFHQVFLRGGSLTWKGEMTPQLLALATVKPRAEWVTLTFQQATAWDRFLTKYMPQHLARTHLAEKVSAPDHWPPLKDGTWSKTLESGPTDEDLETLANEGK